MTTLCHEDRILGLQLTLADGVCTVVLLRLQLDEVVVVSDVLVGLDLAGVRVNFVSHAIMEVVLLLLVTHWRTIHRLTDCTCVS